MKKHAPIALLQIVLLLAALATLAVPGLGNAADKAARKARVAGGAQVELVASAQTPEQWSAKRPQFRDLRPKTRSNVE